MKKAIFLIGTAALAASLLACAADEGDGPDDIVGDGDTGDGDAGTGGSGTDPNRPDSDFVLGGLGTGTLGDTTWSGYMFTVASDISTSTITPEEFTGSNLCVTGFLAAGYEEWALVGWNIAQEIDPETSMGLAVNSIVPGGTGVSVQVANPGLSPLRVQIQADMEATAFWCADVPPAGGVIPWETFRTECWGTAGTAYDPSTPIAQIAVQTYNPSDTMPTTFDYCVIHLGPA